MDEMTNEAVVAEETTPVEEAEAEGLSEAEFNSLWDDDDGGDYGFVESESEAEADQQSEEQVETETTEQTETEQSDTESPDQDYLELKHLDEVKKVSKDEAKVLAQKGMDYDRIRGKLGEADNVIKKLQTYEEFLKEIQGDFPTIEDLMNDTRARVKADKEGISYEDALAKIKETNQSKEAAPAVDEGAVIQKIRKASFEEFAREHPEVKPTDIPKEVWEDLEKTNNLSASYAKYEAKKLKEENETLKKNAKNKSRSTGSMRSSGNASYEKSEFDRIMDEDDW